VKNITYKKDVESLTGLYLNCTTHWMIFTTARFSRTLLMMIFHLPKMQCTAHNIWQSQSCIKQKKQGSC